jgi:RNA polymerase sigma-70 factor (ECF subfamily)
MRNPLSPQEDTELVRAFRGGDGDAFARLMERHQNRIFTTIFLIVRDREQAEDIFQETMIKLIRLIQADQYDEKGKFMAWAVRIARNFAIDEYRRERRGPQMLRENGGYDLSVRHLIQRIPEKQREVLVMRHYAGMSFQEIAEVQGVSINTALGRMRYALACLRKCAGVGRTMEDRNAEQIH